MLSVLFFPLQFSSIGSVWLVQVELHDGALRGSTAILNDSCSGFDNGGLVWRKRRWRFCLLLCGCTCGVVQEGTSINIGAGVGF